MKGFDAFVLAMVAEVPGRRAQAPDPYRSQLRRGDDLPRLARHDRRFGHDEPRPGAVIVGEPTMMQVADAHKGVATFRTRVTGHEAHSAKPALGANAIAAPADIVSEIGRLAREYENGPLDPRFDPPYSTLHVGVIHGGTARNILARECDFHWEFRGLPGVKTAAAPAKVQAFVDQVALPRLTRYRRGPTIETEIEVDVPPLAAAPARPPKRWRSGSPARTLRSPSPSPPKPGISRRPACRPSSAAPARSTRPTSPTSSWTKPSSRRAWPF